MPLRTADADQPHPASLTDAQLLSACDSTRTRRSGPGGQNRNKVETAVILDHRPTGLRSEANERRSQAENLREALFRLRVHLAIEVRKPRFDGPSALWNARLRDGRIAVNPGHTDFPTLLAEALDVLTLEQFDVKSAADVLGCTSSQLVKFLKLEPRALALANRERQRQGARPLL